MFYLWLLSPKAYKPFADWLLFMKYAAVCELRTESLYKILVSISLPSVN
jgi:hypothetical protein